MHERTVGARAGEAEASGEGAGTSHASISISPDSSFLSSRSQPWASIASYRQSCKVCATKGCSGISRAPARFSAHAT